MGNVEWDARYLRSLLRSDHQRTASVFLSPLDILVRVAGHRSDFVFGKLYPTRLEYRSVDRHEGLLELGATDSRSEEHTSELQSLMRISYAVFCLKKTKKQEKK